MVADQSNSKYTSVLNDMIALRMADVLDALCVEYRDDSRMIKCCCPIHGGDNYSAINYYKDGWKVAGYWVCNTRHCHREFKSTALGFVWGIMSHQNKDWEKEGDDKENFKKVIEWCCEFLNVKLEQLTPKSINRSDVNFVRQMDVISQNVLRNADGITREQVLKGLTFPAEYYLQRNYQEKTLRHFDVGYCGKVGKKLYNRVVVPVYDEKKQKAVALTARAVSKEDESRIKWMNYPDKCEIRSFLYNYYNAVEEINKKRNIVVVEGPGDVWRLWEAGCYNCVALFGSFMTERQQILIEKSSAMNLTLMLDNDEAGKRGIEDIKRDLSGYYNLKIPQYNHHDVGGMNVEELRKLLEKENII